ASRSRRYESTSAFPEESAFMFGPRRVLVEPVEPRRLLATVTVTSLADTGAGSLRDAVAAAVPGDTISLAGLAGTIALQSAIDVNKNLIIDGPGKKVLTISGGGNTQVFTQSTEIGRAHV